VVATYAYGSNSREDNIGPLAREMGRAMNCPVRVQSYPNVLALLAALQAGQVDVAFLNTLGYISLQSERPNDLVALARLQAPANDPNAYRACLVARREAGLASLEAAAKQAAALRLVFAGRYSTSGHLVPRLQLARLGLENPEAHCRKAYFATSHAAVLDELRAGRADVGACGLGEFMQLQARGEANDLQLLWASDPIPLGPVVCRATLPAARQQALRELLLTVHELRPTAFAQLCKGWAEALNTTRFVAVKPYEYEAFFKVANTGTALRNLLSQYMH
jgi:phosphate/phosphite/phosphonate ABC transporter binding protein